MRREEARHAIGSDENSESDSAIPELLQAALRFAQCARKGNLAYALIGSLATAHWAETTFPRAIEFLIDVPCDDLPAFLDALEAQGFRFKRSTTIREWTQQDTTTLQFRDIRIGCLKPVRPLYQHVLEWTTTEAWSGHPIRIASAEGLILTKLLTDQTQDRIDIENLVGRRRDTLDLDWIKSEWQSVAALDDPRLVRLVELVGR